jgi:hypothetical protein
MNSNNPRANMLFTRNIRRRNLRRQTQTSIRSDLNGHILKTNPDPSSVNVIPWNSLIVKIRRVQGPLGIPIDSTQQGLVNNLRTQLGLSVDDAIEFRPISLRVWNISGGSVGLRVVDTIPSSTLEFLSVSTDESARNQWATTGYKYPISLQNNTLRADPRLTFQTEANVTGNEILVYFTVLWRPIRTSITSSFFKFQGSDKEVTSNNI